MKIKLIHRQILDEREEQLVNKAGMETFSFLLFSREIGRASCRERV